MKAKHSVSGLLLVAFPAPLKLRFMLFVVFCFHRYAAAVWSFPTLLDGQEEVVDCVYTAFFQRRNRKLFPHTECQ